MRPQVGPTARSLLAPRRLNSTLPKKPVRRKRELPVEEISFRRPVDHVSEVVLEEQPYKVSALGTSIPEDIPKVPLHIEQITGKRLRWYERTMNEDKLSPEDEERLEKAMKRYDKPPRPVIDYQQDNAGPSQERLSWFAMPGEDGADSGIVDVGDVTPGLEPGRVVEIRRETSSHLGMILAPITINQRDRLLVLRSTGEIWPVSMQDVQFVMPKSLVKPELSAAAWHPDLLKMWQKGEDIGQTGSAQTTSLIGPERAGQLLKARREVAILLRRVLRETERMKGRLLGGTVNSGTGGGMDAIWEGLAPEDPERRGSVSAAWAAEYLLNKSAGEQAGGKRITVREGTLPAYAAHQLLMDRPDLFLAADVEMHTRGVFLVRSRADIERFQRVEKLVNSAAPEFVAFVEKGNAVREKIRNGADAGTVAEWTELERDILYQLALGHYERRSSQTLHAITLATAIAKWFMPDPSAVVTFDVLGPLLVELGIISVYDTTMTSRVIETARRQGESAGWVPPASFGETANEPVAADAALDSLRQDFSHRVYVIDDPTALELDDGIALEEAGDGQYWVHMYVADPTRFMARDGDLSRASNYMGTSHYLNEGTVPMLPESFKPEGLSLGAGGSGSPVMVFSARVDRAGAVHDWKVGMGFNKNTVVTTYAAVDKALGFQPARKTYPLGRPVEDMIVRGPVRQLDTLADEHTGELKTLLELSEALRAKRYKNAGFEYTGANYSAKPYNIGSALETLHDRAAFPTTSQVWNPANVESVTIGFEVTPEAVPTSSNTMISEFMVLANQIAAWFCTEHKLTVSFRGSEAVTNTSQTPEHLTVDKLLAQRTPGTGLLDMAQIRIGALLLSSSAISPTPIPHWLMGLNQGKGYVWATSPLRRYEDMLAHWQIKGALAAQAGIQGGEGILSEQDIWPRIKNADFAQQLGKNAGRVSSKFFASMVMRQRLNGPLPAGYEVDEAERVDLRGPVDALIVGQASPFMSSTLFKADISIPSLGVIGELLFPDEKAAKQYAPGDSISVAFDDTHTNLWPVPAIMWKPYKA